MRKVWPRYIYTYVFDVYDVMHDDKEYHGYTYYDMPSETFKEYAFATMHWPNAKIVPRPTTCTCTECGKVTICASFRELVPLHTKQCKHARPETRGGIETDTPEIPQPRIFIS